MISNEKFLLIFKVYLNANLKVFFHTFYKFVDKNNIIVYNVRVIRKVRNL